MLPVASKIKTTRRRTQNGAGKQKSRLIPFSRPTLGSLESDQELALLLNGLELDTGAVYDRFEEMGLKTNLLKGIHAYGLEKPAAIQQRAILPCIKGRDVIVQAQSGMGKTAALAISILERIDLGNPECQALVIAPTRELAEQIREVFAALGKFMGATTFTCIGGTNMTNCKAALVQGKQIVVGTTGRILHMMREKHDDVNAYLDVKCIKTLALDEADKMLTGEFHRDITELFAKIFAKTQIILMSATMPEHILKLTDRFMRKPIKILVKNNELTLEGIRQYYLNVDTEEWKLSTLSDIYEAISKAQGMIFCNSRKEVTTLSTKMAEFGHIVSAMRGDLQQKDRDLILRKFRNGSGESRMLITSDILARGIDVQQVNLVINYAFPIRKEEYIHRVGRGGRYGRKGVAITFITTQELERIKELEEFYCTKIVAMPSVKDIVDLLKPALN